MKISNHRLQTDDGTPVEFIRSPNVGGKLEPQYLVMHYTAGSGARASINWLTNRDAKASAHLVIARDDGAVTQLVPFDRVAWHAGQSRWEGLSGLNHHSIGIELDNAGILTRQGSKWRAWFGADYDADQVVEATHKNEIEPRGWHAFTQPQIESAIAVARALVRKYRLKDVIGHDDIAPGRKTDPGPAFPMESFRAAVMGRADDDAPVFETATHLNIRGGPGTEFDKVRDTALPPGTRLLLHMRETDWCQVDVLDANGDPELSGWVHGAYIRRA